MPKYTGAVHHAASFPGTDDDAKVANCIAKIKSAVPRWLTATMIFEAGTWEFNRPIIIDRPISLTSSGKGAMSCLLGFGKGIEEYGRAVHYLRVNRSAVTDLSIIFNAGESINNCVMLDVEDSGRNTFDSLWIAPGRNAGLNNIGVRHLRGAGRSGRGESNWFTNLNIVAPKPIVMFNGDNCHFRNADVGTYNASVGSGCDGDHVSAGIEFISPSFNTSFTDMSFQNGDHLLYCDYVGKGWGNQLTLQDIRYEQQRDHTKAAVHYHAKRTNGMFGQEMLTLINPRCSHAPKANPTTDVEGVRHFSIVGGHWCGADYHAGQQPNSAWPCPAKPAPPTKPRSEA